MPTVSNTSPTARSDRATAPGKPYGGNTFGWLVAVYGVLAYAHAGPPAKHGSDVLADIAFAACLAWFLVAQITTAVAAARAGQLRRCDRIAAVAAAVALIALPAIWLVFGISPAQLFVTAGAWVVAVTILTGGLALGVLSALIQSACK